MVGSVSPMLPTSQPTQQCLQLSENRISVLFTFALCVCVCARVRACICVYTRHVWVPKEKETPCFSNMCTVRLCLASPELNLWTQQWEVRTEPFSPARSGVGTRKVMRTGAEDLTPWNVINNAKCHSWRHGARSHGAPNSRTGIFLLSAGRSVHESSFDPSWSLGEDKCLFAKYFLFFILPRPAKHDLKFQSHVTSSKVQF